MLDELIALGASHPRISTLLVGGDEVTLPPTWDEWASEEPVRSLTMLILEDDALSQELLRLRLESMGHAVLIADSVEGALALVKQELPHLALVDLELGEDKEAGLSFIHQLRADPHSAQIPALHSVYVRHASELPQPLRDVQAFLPMPFKLEQLAEIIASACKRTASASDVLIL